MGKFTMLPKPVAAAVVSVLKADAVAEGYWKKCCDTFRAAGIMAADLAATRGEVNPLRDDTKRVIISTLTAKERAMLAADPATLSEVQKMHRKEAQQKVGKKLSKIEAHLKRAEEADANGGVRVTKSPVERIKVASLEIRNMLEKEYDFGFDVVKAKAAFAAFVATITAPAKVAK